MDEDAFAKRIEALPISRTKREAAKEDLAAANALVEMFFGMDALIRSLMRWARSSWRRRARLRPVKV
jgi:hypothetical protein